MSDQVNKAFVQQYQDSMIILSQQKESRMAPIVRKKMTTGKTAYFDRLGATTAQLRTSRHADTPLVDTPHSRRRVDLLDYDTADLVDKADLNKMLIDPTSEYARAQTMAMGRKIDDVVIAAAQGNAQAIDAADASSNVALVHTIDQSFGTTDSDIIVEKVIEAKRLLMSNEVDPSEDIFFVLDSTSIHNMLKETEVGSIDYNSVKALVRGDLDTFMGFKFIHSERLLDNSEGFKNCLAFARSGIALAIGEDVIVRVSERADKGYSTQVYTAMTIGAVRLEEEKVIVVEAKR